MKNTFCCAIWCFSWLPSISVHKHEFAGPPWKQGFVICGILSSRRPLSSTILCSPLPIGQQNLLTMNNPLKRSNKRTLKLVSFFSLGFKIKNELLLSQSPHGQHSFLEGDDERKDYREADLCGQRLFVTGLAATVDDSTLFLDFQGCGAVEARVVKPGEKFLASSFSRFET